MNEIPIFVINLKQDTEKRKHMYELCQKYSLNCHFIDAIFGKDLDASFVKEVTDDEVSRKIHGKLLSRGEIGCALSHIKIYREIVEKKIENAIIFEDDIVLEKGFEEIIGKTKNFPEDWEVMLLGYYSRASDELISKSSLWFKKNLVGDFHAVRLVQLAFGTHGYMINSKGVKKLLDSLETIVKPIDHYTGIESYVNMYAIKPRVVRISDKFKYNSSIDQERIEQMKKSSENIKSPFKRILHKIGLLRKARELKILLKTLKVPKKYSA